MRRAYITTRKPMDIAHEVERLRREGWEGFVLRSLDGGGTLDLERLGAARYAAGLQVDVELDCEPSPVASRATAVR